MPHENHGGIAARPPSWWRRLLACLGRPHPAAAAAYRLYVALVRQARSPVFYQALGVPDTPAGRFELLAWHVAFAVQALGRAGAGTGQALVELMVADLDVNLRELGVGDLSVGKQVRRLAGQFHARLRALDEAAAPAAGGLGPVLLRNTYHGGPPPAAAQLVALERYLVGLGERLQALGPDRLAAGDLALADLQSVLELCHARQHNDGQSNEIVGTGASAPT